MMIRVLGAEDKVQPKGSITWPLTFCGFYNPTTADGQNPALPIIRNIP